MSLSTEEFSTSTLTEIPNACALCLKRDAEQVFVVQDRNVVRCRSCGLVYVDPWIEDSALYVEEYFTVRNNYIAHQTQFREIFEDLFKQIDARIAPGIMLDIGCGPGLLLDVGRQHGWEPYGVEISEWAAQFAREELHLPVQQGTLEDTHYPLKHFDLIVLNHVLEHVPDPVHLLEIAHDILKDNGLFVVGVPNIDSLYARLNKERWPSLRVYQHRWHFSPKTLTMLLAKSGFSVESITTDNREPWGGVLKKSILSCLSLMTRVTNSGESMVAFSRKAQM